MAGEEEEKRKEEDRGDELGVIRRDLYAREQSEEVRHRQEELQRLGVKRQRPVVKPQKASDILNALKFKNLSLIRAKRWGRVLRFSGILALLLIIMIVAVAATVMYRSARTVTKNQVVLEVGAPPEFTAGDEIVYRISYGNASRVNWLDVELVVDVPRGFTYRSASKEIERSGRQIVFKIGRLNSGEEGELIVRGQLIGEQNETATVRTKLVLTPENFPSGRFPKTAAKATTITALPLDVSLNIADDAASGERVMSSVMVRNLSGRALEGVYLQVKPAPGVQLALEDIDFTPGFSTVDSSWRLSRLEPLGDKELTLVFYVEGQTGEKRVIDFEAGISQRGENFVQRELSHVVNISTSEVVVQQVYNGSTQPVAVRAGSRISGEVRYRNVGTVGLKDVIVEVKFEGASFNPVSLELSSGFYDPVEKKIFWSAATVPELAVLQPQQEGTVNYSFSVFDTDTLADTAEAKNHVLVTTATVDSPDLPAPAGQPRRVISDRAVISVRTNLILQAAALYDDGRLGLISSGPLPPQVGEETTYTVRWRIGSTLNDVGDVRLTAVLPDGVSYTGQMYKTAGQFEFNERTGTLKWTVPYMEGLTGKAVPYQELHMQVAITPGENKRGESVPLLNKTNLTAVDQFTDEAISATLPSFPDTETAAPGKGRVQ